MRSLSSFLGWSLVGAVGVLVLLACGYAAGYRWNLSESAPRGLYRRTHEPLQRGTLVAFCLPLPLAQFGSEREYIQPVPSWTQECQHGYQPLLKPIVAVAGDVVHITADLVLINNRPVPNSATQAQDSQGRPLPHVVWGAYEIHPGEMWVMSTDLPNSWDSRYYGPIREASVIATARPVWVWL